MSPPLMIISMLYVYFWTGHSISVAQAFAGIQVLYFIERPLRWFPDFLGKLFEFEVSTKRINRFLTWNEFNGKLISESDYALKKRNIDLWIKNANFTWNFINNFEENKVNEIASNIKSESIRNDLSSQCELNQIQNCWLTFQYWMKIFIFIKKTYLIKTSNFILQMMKDLLGFNRSTWSWKNLQEDETELMKPTNTNIYRLEL